MTEQESYITLALSKSSEFSFWWAYGGLAVLEDCPNPSIITSKSLKQNENQSVSQSVSQSVIQSINPINQSVNSPILKSIGQSISQSVNHQATNFIHFKPRIYNASHMLEKFASYLKLILWGLYCISFKLTTVKKKTDLTERSTAVVDVSVRLVISLKLLK